MANNRNQNWKIGLGVLAGAAFGWWLNSEQGRKVRTQVQDGAQDLGQQATTFVRDQAENVNHYYLQGKEAVTNAAETVREAVQRNFSQAADQAEEAVDQAGGSMKKGINRAKKKVASDNA